MALKEDYLDDILDTSVNEKRKYRMINNADGTISLEDVTEYSQNGDNFGAFDINITNKTVNELIAMGLNVRCNSNGYLEVKVDGVWKPTDLKAVVNNEILFSANNNAANFVSYMGGINGLNYPAGYSPELTVGQRMTATLNSSGGAYSGCIISDLIDVTDYAKIVMSHESTSTGSTTYESAFLFVTSTKKTEMDALAKSLIMSAKTNASGIVELDISNITGKVYIGISLQANKKTITVNVEEMYLE